ncbi:MAG: LacI family DNA-binding transcriptional regulator [Eubacteriales bacterium]|nr:LacI family DNA-binding transcriptional regulator [Eubacteriales bacterium]
MAVTIKDVARETNLAVSTISKYMNGGKVRAQNQKLIEEAVERLGYQPNNLARGLRNSRTYTIGFLMQKLEGSHSAKLVECLEKKVQEMGCFLTIYCHRESAELARGYVEFLTEKMVDGIIVSPVCTTEDYLKPARDAGIPYIILEDTNGVTDADVVQVDCASASYQIVEHLIEQGHRRIAIIQGMEGTTTSRERLNGYLRVMEDYELPVNPEYLVKGMYDYQSGYEGIQKLWGLKQRPTAVFVTNYHMSIGALVAINRLGIRVPQELSVAAFDDLELSSLVQPHMTAVRQPLEGMMEEACRLLAKRMDGDFEGFPEKKRLKAEVICRDSVARIR